MNFTVKEIYLTLLPGFLILANLFFSASLFSLSQIETNEATILLLACLILGYVNNVVASVIERNILKVKYRGEDQDTLREQLNAIPFDNVIEEYFIHYAQARNMCMAFVISALLVLYHILTNDKNGMLAFCVFFSYLVIFVLLCIAYERHRKRYHALIEQKYNSLKQNKQL